MKLHDLVDFNPTERLSSDTQVPFVDMAALPQFGRDIQGYVLRYPASSGARFVNGDTLLARITPCLENGKGAQVRILPDGTTGQGSTEFIVLRAKIPSDSDFVYYVSRHPDFRQHAIRQMTGTSGRQRVAWQSLADYELPDTEPCQRTFIGAILGALDDKIELNRRMNETLEAMARAIFKDWFVDFGPTRAKMAMRGEDPQKENVARAPYLAPDIWSLFPDRLDDKGKPEGWTLRPVCDFAVLRGGKQLEKERFTPTGTIPVFGGAGVMGFTNEHNADGFVISVGRVGAYCGQFFSHRGKAWINNNASLIRQFEGTSDEWLFQSLRQADIEVIKKGAAQPFISNTDLENMPIIWPGENIVRRFTEVAAPLMLKIEQNNMEASTLAATRDLLLPKLLSGDVRVKDAEKIAGAAI